MTEPYAYQVWLCSVCDQECEAGSAEVGDLVCLVCGNEYELSYATNARLVRSGDIPD